MSRRLRVTAPSGLRMRLRPDTRSKVLRALPLGSEVEELTRRDGWVQVRSQGPGSQRVDGWMSAKWLARVASPRWRLAGSLAQLRAQVDQRWPGRSKRHDGTIGDAAHASRTSDHNPDGSGVVRAFDCTDDDSGCDGARLVAALVASRDPRISYLIHDGRIWRSYAKPGLPAWTPEVYRGANPHRTHVHVSVVSDPARYDDPSPWALP